MTLTQIPTREILHFLGWHGTPVEPGLKETIKRFQEEALRKIEPRVVVREFELSPDGTLAHTRFLPLGKDVPAMLSDCRSAVLLAATLGAAAHQSGLRQVRPADRHGQRQSAEYAPYLRRRLCRKAAPPDGLYRPPPRCCRPVVHGRFRGNVAGCAGRVSGAAERGKTYVDFPQKCAIISIESCIIKTI